MATKSKQQKMRRKEVNDHHWEPADKAFKGRGWVNNHSLLVTNTPLFDQVKRIILKRVWRKQMEGQEKQRETWLFVERKVLSESNVVGQCSREHYWKPSVSVWVLLDMTVIKQQQTYGELQQYQRITIISPATGLLDNEKIHSWSFFLPQKIFMTILSKHWID